MKREVLILANGGGFMVNAIANGLKKEEFTVHLCEARVNDLGKMEELPRLVVLYLDEELTDNTEILVYLRDRVVENGLQVFLVGSPEEITESGKILTEKFTAGTLVRPLNVGDLAKKLEESVEAGTRAEAKKKILIVDDDPTMLRMIRGLLAEKYQVYMAGSGMNAITFLATNKVDLILLDYEMPVITGAKVLEMIRSEVSTESIPVMFLTSKNDRESVLQVVALKPEKYLLKTMPPEEWLKNIDEFFAAQACRM
ncbi:MAG: response regulator [Lachnospiraceae bacterium]|nr:response regulator [Lachnospiraceae bacterium]